MSYDVRAGPKVARRKVPLTRLIASIAGAAGAILLARLLLRLLAARPDNPAVAMLYAVTAPFVAPLAWLDAGQPKFGAVLELSTLALILVVVGAGLVAWAVGRGPWGRTTT